MSGLDPQRLRAFARRLREAGRKHINRPALWSAFHAAFPARPQGVEEREMLLAALKDLERQGILKLPAAGGSGWDRTFQIAVPIAVTLVIDRPSAAGAAWRTFPWHARLSWVAALPTLSAENEAFLRRVHHALVNEEFSRPAPLKYRSLQLTGDEKRLKRLTKTGLFGPGRLDSRLLNCTSEVLPLVSARTGDRPSVLIFENAGPFSVARAVLSQMADAPYGLVVFGGGRGVTASLPALLEIDRRIERVDYVGDLDAHGLRIASAVRHVAQEVGLPDVRLTGELYRVMLQTARRFGRPEGWPDRSGGAACSAELTELLPEAVRGEVASLIRAGRRIPEEVLGPDELLSAWKVP